MPLINFDDRTKNDLKVCGTMSTDFFAQFCKIALDFLKTGANQKMFIGASQKLNVQPSDVEAAVASIARIFMEGAKSALTRNDLLFSIGDLGLSSELCESMAGFYGEKKEEILVVLLKAKSSAIPEFASLNWRLEVEVASRSRHNTFEPSFLVELGTKSREQEEPSKLLLEADHANMKHLQSELEAALQELKSTHMLRVTRFLDM
jgi:hypothetical protein